MRPRRVIAGLVVLTVAVALVALWPRGPRPCRATFEQVREGMTYDDVCATVGGPPGDYTGRYPAQGDMLSSLGGARWHAGDADLRVVFGPGDRVLDAAVSDPPGGISWWSAFRARLGL